MHDASVWSVNVGRLGGIRVRLHVLFLLFGIITIYLSTLSKDRDLAWYGAASLAILLVSVLLHELAHCYAAIRCGGRAEEIVIGPFGGLAQPVVPREPQSELVTALAGPAVNLVLCFTAAPLLLLVGSTLPPGLLNPLRPDQVVEGAPQEVFLKLVFWLNWVLVLINLLPAFPFDGGRALRAILWPLTGYRHAVVLVSRAAKLAAIGLCLLAWWTHEPAGGGVIQAWVPLVLLAVLLFFSAKQELARGSQQELQDDMFGYDFSQGYTSLERDVEPSHSDEPGLLQRWLQKRREEKQRLLREREAAEEDRVDVILAQLHLHGKGVDSLSAEDRALLERVSARYRNRLKQ